MNIEFSEKCYVVSLDFIIIPFWKIYLKNEFSDYFLKREGC